MTNPKVVIEMLICDCGCGDTIIRSVSVDGVLVNNPTVNSIHGAVVVNDDGDTEIQDEDGNVLELVEESPDLELEDHE